MSVRRLLSPLLAAAVATALVPGAAGATEPYQAAVDITFPTVASATFIQDYHQPRSGGRVHKATDLMVAKHAPAYAAVAGTVCYITGVGEPMPSWGYSLSICGDDGRRYVYIHMNNDRPGTDDGLGGPEHAYAPGIRRGAAVTRGQLVGWIGDSGNAESTASHLHLEIHDDRVTDPYGTHRIDPYLSLAAARARGDVPGGTGAALTPSAPAAPAVPSARVAGSDRVATAIALSRDSHDAASVAVLAPSTLAAAAIVSGPLAAALDGPVLTTHPSAADPRVLAELERLGVDRVVAVGLPVEVAEALTAAGFAVERVGGDDRYGLAAAVAARTWQAQGPGEDGEPVERRVVLALGDHADPTRAWPDSLMASYFGAATGQPVLLAAPGALPAATADALAGATEVTIIGGEGVVPATVADAIRALGTDVQRLSGKTRYSTALAVSDELIRRDLVSADRTWVATGRNWPDAATSGPAVATAGDLLLLVDGAGQGADGETRSYLGERAGAVERIVAIGGDGVVTSTVLSAVATWAG